MDLRDALHVTNGDATDLPGTGLAPRLVHWRDVLHEGPVPALPAVELRVVRAEFLTSAGADDRGEAEAMFAARDRAIKENRDGSYVLWFEADLYDQLQLIQVLDRLAMLGVDPERVWLICIGEHPEVARFGGLGQLSADQLRELPGTNAMRRLTPEGLDLAGRAWAAFTAPAPDRLGSIAREESVDLRFLGAAFDRLSREYPWTRDGLSLTQRRLLAAVANGAASSQEAFVGAAAREARPYLGDTWAFATLDRLAECPVPLVTGDPLELTSSGRAVLAGTQDHVELNGLDRWLGGVHLDGPRAVWRWDDGQETLSKSH